MLLQVFVLSVLLFLKRCPRQGLCSHYCKQMRALFFSPIVRGAHQPAPSGSLQSHITWFEVSRYVGKPLGCFQKQKYAVLKWQKRLLVISVKRSAKRSSCWLFIFILKYGCIEGLSVPAAPGHHSHPHLHLHNKLYVSLKSVLMHAATDHCRDVMVLFFQKAAIFTPTPTPLSSPYIYLFRTHKHIKIKKSLPFTQPPTHARTHISSFNRTSAVIISIITNVLQTGSS